MKASVAAALALAVTGCSACGDLPWVELRGERYCVEIADDDAERTQGLMFRDALADDHGMLFLFEREEPQSFWMMNTRIPLDIFYFDAQRRLVSVSERTPPCRSQRCPGYPSAGPAKYVLELNAGAADALGAKPGDELVFGPGIDDDDA